MQPDVPPTEGEGQPPSAQQQKGEDDADRLGQDRGQSRTSRPHVEPGHQNEVARDVAGAGHGHGDQGRFGVPHAPHDAAQHVVGHDHDVPGPADGQVPPGLVEGFRRGVHEPHQTPGQQGHQDGQQHAGPQEQQNAGADDPAQGVPVPLAQLLPQQDGGPHGEGTDQPRDGHHELGPDGHPGHVRRHGVFAHDDQIHGPVQRLQKQGQQDRQTKPKQRSGDGPLCEIRFSMHPFPPKQRAGQENGRLSPQSYPARHFL